MNRIVWLASYPKSGNTWLRAFLANLFTGAETPFDINRLSDFTMSDMRAGYFERVAGRPLDQLSFEQINELRPRVHRHLARQRPHSVFVKTHNAISTVGKVPTITPEVTAGAIYVVRNPLDVVVSYAHHMNLGIEESVAALNDVENYLDTHDRVVFQFLSSWSNHVRSWTTAPGLHLHVMRYEDMLEDPMRSFAATVGFLGVEAPPDRLERAIRFSSFKEMRAQEESRGFRERSAVAPAFFRRGRKDAWRQALTPAQVDAIVQANGEMMARFDYLP